MMNQAEGVCLIYYTKIGSQRYLVEKMMEKGDREKTYSLEARRKEGS
jgi:hypothetical protein